MNKGKKTTQEERAEIVAFCIEHGKDYGLAMEKYSVSYQQIYSWVRKYEASEKQGYWYISFIAGRKGFSDFEVAYFYCFQSRNYCF